MKTYVGPHVLEFLDTGAPRGERNWWTVRLNGYTLYCGPKRIKADKLHRELIKALQEASE